MHGNTLIDNSEHLKLVNILNEIITLPEVEEICIATSDFVENFQVKFVLCKK
ncbi:MAG: hypothetical protein HDR51_01175 [Treponema sp.]|nr:hypothetical protein [Treponema sp.]MBD5411351.1 hypothetical protein [Treponema sp.]